MSNEMYHVSVLSALPSALTVSGHLQVQNHSKIHEPFSNLFMSQVFFFLPTVSMTQMLAYLLSGLRLISFGRV